MLEQNGRKLSELIAKSLPSPQGTDFLKAGFRLRRSRRRKSAYDLVKFENRSHKFNGIGIGRTFNSISSDCVYDSVAYDPVKTRLSESEAEAEEPTNQKAQNLALRLV